MTEKQLIDLLQTDPENGIEKITDLYGGAIKMICRNILSAFSEEDVEEVISDILVAIWKSVNRFDRERGTSFKSYCYGIARKTALAKRKEAAKDFNTIPLEEDLLFDTAAVENEYDRKEEERLLHEAISELDEPERSIFILRYFYFFRIKEIAERLQLTEKRVENCLYRGRHHLKDMLVRKGVER